MPDQSPAELHQAILNIPCQTPASEHAYAAFSRGHRAAIHAAAELALSRGAVGDDGVAVDWKKSAFDTAAELTRQVDRVRGLTKALSAMVEHCSQPRMTGMKDQDTRLQWYVDLGPIREAARELLREPIPHPAGERIEATDSLSCPWCGGVFDGPADRLEHCPPVH